MTPVALYSNLRNKAKEGKWEQEVPEAEGFSANGMHGYLSLSSSTQATGWLSSGSGTTTHRLRCDKDIEGVFAFSSASCLELCTGVFQDWDYCWGWTGGCQGLCGVARGWQDGCNGQVWVSPAAGREKLVGSGSKTRVAPSSQWQEGLKATVKSHLKETRGHSQDKGVQCDHPTPNL